VSSATSNKLVSRPLMDALLHLVQRGWAWAGPILAVPKCNGPRINGQSTSHRIAV